MAFACAPFSAFAEGAAYKAPRTPYGTPDLQGIWTNTALTWLQRPPNIKGLVATRASQARAAGMDGLVCSPEEAAALKLSADKVRKGVDEVMKVASPAA